MQSPDAAVDPNCVSADVRSAATLIVSGQVQSFTADEPLDDAEVRFSTAWDAGDSFPEECPAIASFTTDADGRFGPETVEAGSPRTPPVAIFMVTGDEVAPTASDQTFQCDTSDCGNLAHTIRTPSAELASTWRAQLADGGMQDADSTGLVLFEFRETDGMPAAGVIPTGLWPGSGDEGEVDLAPGTQVRFLAADRATLEPADATETTASGLAVISFGDTGDVVAAAVAGHRGEAEVWAGVGVLTSPGWLFLEDRRRTGP